eukprot:6465481-Amphidinium_carterae.1
MRPTRAFVQNVTSILNLSRITIGANIILNKASEELLAPMPQTISQNRNKRAPVRTTVSTKKLSQPHE